MKEPHTDLGLGAITNRRVETPTIDSAHLQSPRRSSSRDNEAREVQRLPTQTEPRSSYPWKTACPEENAQPNLRETIQDKGLAIPLPSGEVASGSTSSNAFEKQGKAPSIELLRGHWSSSPHLPSIKCTPSRPEVHEFEPVPILPMLVKIASPTSRTSKEPKRPALAAKHGSRHYSIRIEAKDSDKDSCGEGSTSYTKLLIALCKNELVESHSS
jgi:hypothetical protein